MAVNSDYILQQILNQNQAMNDNLSNIRDLLADSIKQDKKDSKDNKNNNQTQNRPSNTGSSKKSSKSPFTTAFKSIGTEMGNVTKTMLNSSTTTSTAINAVGMSAKSVAGAFSMIPGPIGIAANAFSMVADAGMAVYNYLNEQLQLYNKISSSGVSLADGMNTVRKSAATAMVSVNQMADSFSKHSEAVAQLSGAYGNGAMEFAKLAGNLQIAQTQAGLYGLSQETLMDLTARNIKIQKQLGGMQQLREIDQTKSTQEFISNITTFSKSIGMSVDALLKKTESLDNSLDARALETSLEAYSGLSSKVATKATKAFNEATAAMGDSAATAARLMAHRLTKGGVPDDLLAPMINGFADITENMLRSGITDAKEIRRQQLKYVKENKNAIKKDMLDQISIGNTAAAEMLRGLLNMEAAANNPQNQMADRLAQATQNINVWFNQHFIQPFTDMFNNIILYISDVITSTDSIGEAFVKIAVAATDKIFETIADILMIIPTQLYKLIGGDSDIAKNMTSSAEEFVKGLFQIPKKIIMIALDILSGQTDKLVEDVTSMVKNIVNPFRAIATNVESIFKGLSFDTILENIKSGFHGMQKFFAKIRDWFGEDEVQPIDKPPENVDGFNTSFQKDSTQPHKPFPPIHVEEQPKNKVSKVETGEEQAKPETIEDRTLRELEKQQRLLDALNTLNDMLNEIKQTNTQGNDYLRTISENTHGDRNR